MVNILYLTDARLDRERLRLLQTLVSIKQIPRHLAEKYHKINISEEKGTVLTEI